ncbi:MAG: hypothetical protein LQ350_005368 [Teloschistes chrysophthalmus]|nr:MAG: hypothetical protein LQ350_005368 [Niorma chrysophthalma]
MSSKEHPICIPSTPSRENTPANPETPERGDSIAYIPTIEGTLGREKTLDERVTGIPCPAHQKGSLVVKPNADMQKAMRKAQRGRAPSPSYKGVNAFQPATPVSAPDTNETPQKDDSISPIGAALFSTTRPSTLTYTTTPLTTTTPSPNHRASSPPGTHTPGAPRSTAKSNAWFRARHDSSSSHPHFDFASSPPDARAIFSVAHPSTLVYSTTPLTTTTPSPNHRASSPPGTHTPNAPSLSRMSSEYYLRGRKEERSPSRRYLKHKSQREAPARSRSASPTRTPVKPTYSTSIFAGKLAMALSGNERAVSPPGFVEKLIEAAEARDKDLDEDNEFEEEQKVEAKGTGEMGPPATPAKRATKNKKGAMGPPPSPSTSRFANPITVGDPFTTIATAPSAPATQVPATPKKHRTGTMLQGLLKGLTGKKGKKRAATSPIKRTPSVSPQRPEPQTPSPKKEGDAKGEEEVQAPGPRTPGRKRVKKGKKDL